MNDTFQKHKDWVRSLLWSMGGLFLCIFAFLLMANPKSKSHPLPIVVKTMTIELSSPLQRRHFSGQIQSSNQIDLSFDVSGQLVEYPVKEGEIVQKNQVLARLNPKHYQDAYEEEKSKFHQVSSRYEKAKKLIKTQIISQNEFNTIEREFKASKHHIDSSQNSIKNTVLLAPFSGQINRKYLKNYQYIQEKQPIVSLQDPYQLEIRIDMPERLLPKTESAKENIRFSAIFDGLPNKIPLIVKSYGSTNDLTLHTHPVILTFPKLQGVDMRLLPGMPVDVVVEYNSPKTLSDKKILIPLSAIWVGDNQKKYVWVIDPKKMIVHKREIQVFPFYQQDKQHVKGLNKGEKIVTAGTYNLHEGAEIKLYRSNSALK